MSGSIGSGGNAPPPQGSAPPQSAPAPQGTQSYINGVPTMPSCVGQAAAAESAPGFQASMQGVTQQQIDAAYASVGMGAYNKPGSSITPQQAVTMAQQQSAMLAGAAQTNQDVACPRFKTDLVHRFLDSAPICGIPPVTAARVVRVVSDWAGEHGSTSACN